ncbi:MAG TPA: AMP-binding protein [Acidimicrobiales bacterium]|nr:AMP-binding protein [Acidimicrobiales bacterium]
MTRGVTEHARQAPQRPALIAPDAEGGAVIRTYGELDGRARRLARVLRARGAGPDRPVAAVLRNGPEPFEVATAAAMAGAAFLPLNWHLKEVELAYLLDDARVGVVVGHQDLSAHLPPGGERELVLLGAPKRSGRSYEHLVEAATADASLDSGAGPELIFYTSGTTAHPKGVVHAGLGDPAVRHLSMGGQVALWGWSEDDVYVMSGPCYHASHAGWGLTALYAGATTVLPSRFDAEGFLRTVERYGGTRSFMVPAHFIRVLQLPEPTRTAIDARSLKLVVHGGAPCPLSVKRRMMAAFPGTEFHELYGASEGGATRISPQEWLEHPGSVGRPWPGVEILIRGEDGSAMVAGEDGIIFIRPASSSRFTYRNDPDATAHAWLGDAFTVGDIGHLSADGYLTITDRVSDMVLWGGVNIAPREIEEVLYEHPDVVDCAVFGVPDARDGEHLKALVELRAPVSWEALAAHVRERLADYKVPREWEEVGELPRDPNGKVLKRLLRGSG